MGAMRVDGVEVKANLEDDLDHAVDVLGLGDGDPMRIWFYDDLTPGMDLPLLEAGLAVRVRSKKGGEDGDCTVKLRPARHSQLTERWLETTETEDLELRLELDRSADRTVLAASLQGDLGHGTLAKVAGDDGLPEDAVAGLQRTFLDDCAPVRVNLACLRRLGPVAATRWKTVGPASLAALGVRAERWTVGDLDFLELSVKVDAEEADATVQQLTAALAGLPLSVATKGETKTRRVLTHLAGRAR